MVKILTMEQMTLTTVMHAPYGLSNLASPTFACGTVTRNCDRIRCPLDTLPLDQDILSLNPLRDHYIYEHRHLQPYKVPAYRGRGRELK